MLNDNVRLKSSLKDIKEILLIRSARMEQVNRVIDDLKGRFHQVNITVLTQPQVSEELLKNPIVKDVILYKEKKFNIFKGFKYLPRIRKRKYDLVVILYNTSGGVGYSNVEWFSLLVKTRHRIGYDADGFIYKLSLRDYLLKLKFPIKILLNLTVLLFIVVGIKPVSIIKNFKRRKRKILAKHKKKFHIGIDIRLLSYGTGIARVEYNLIKNLPLLDNGFIYTIFQDTRKDLFAYPNLKKRIINIPIYNWQEQFFFPKELLFNKIDLFHGIHFITPLIKPCKSIVTIHDLISLHSQPYSKQCLQQERRWIPFSAKAADAIIAISESTKSDIIKFLNISENKIKVIYPGVDHAFYRVIEDFKLIESTKDKYNLPSQYILSVGPAGIRKNHIGIIKAYHKLKQEEAIPYKLVLVGRADFFPKEIFNIIKNSGLEDDIIFTGYIPDEDLPILYNAATLFVFPSFFEGFGLPVLEAMACGTPVITSNTSSLPEVAGDAAILVDPYSEEEIAEAMYKVLTNDSLREDMREKGLSQASKFSWEKCAKETLEVYKEVLGI